MQSDILLGDLGDQKILYNGRRFHRVFQEPGDVCHAVLHIDEWGKKCNDVRTR
jgi:hypothetical protein